ncbi:BBE domain-containing protein [Chenggangzhangella methanolivorans]|uniref:BBE domain-containing protein n=2 Tax=Chenggangzhangella methanolivorans TaxID=1437009 RepID=A0A9E6R5Z1_9HYPH|nr:BBE domain-containing protein [Chenggangzhangella methanolivorans]
MCGTSAYQNFPDPSLTDWRRAYYGDNLARLEQVKAAYDPTNMFRHDQSL